MIVIHYTAMQTAQAACQTLCNPENEVSAHYLIAEDGAVMSLVAEEQRAWHAGAGCWGMVTDVNSRSIGIELANPGDCPFAAPLMDALVTLLHQIKDRWDIPAHRIIGHSDLAPGRKIDPGPRFDWARLAREGLAIAAQPAKPAPLTMFRQLAQGAGYTADTDDETLLRAFRLRHRPHATGPLGDADMALLTDLATRFPVDGPPVTA